MTRKLALPPGTVVLWEGTVALELARLTGFSEYTIQVETDSAARRTRFDRFYRLRGLEPDEISAIRRAEARIQTASIAKGVHSR